MTTVTPFPEPDDWSRLNSIWKANRDLQKLMRAISPRPFEQVQRSISEANRRSLQEMTRSISEANRRSLQEMTRSISEANRRPLQELKRTISEANRRPLRELQRTISEMNRRPLEEFQRAISEMNRRPMRELQDMLRGFNTQTLAGFSGFASTRGGAFAAAAAGLAAEADAAADLASADATDEAPGWLAKLPITVQLGLLVAILQALDEFGKFLADAANADVPDEVGSATQTLFAIAVVLMMVIELRSKPPDA